MVPNSDSREIDVRSPFNADDKLTEVNEKVVEQYVSEKSEISPGDQESNTPSSQSDEPAPHEYATPRELGMLSTVFTIATFMIAIDGSILATAIPHITATFHRLDDVSWYGSAYLLTEIAFQPTFGRLYKLFDHKILYLISILIFEGGSILSAASPTSAALIIGRAISGAGAAGLLCGSLAIFGRINLPAGAVTFALAFFSFKRKAPVHARLSLREKLEKVDILGGFLIIAGLVALFVALQWGGSKYLWSNPKVYGCIIVFGVLISAFVWLQIRKKEDATIPIRILLQRTVAISCLFNLLIAMAQNTHNYYLAFYFQSVLGTNAVMSGVRGLAYGIPGSIAIIITGACISSKGHYVPFMWLGTSIFVAGCVLLRTLDIDSSPVKWICYQIISGFGLGLAEQVPFIAVQVVLPDDDMPIACALVIFSRCFGGAVGLTIAYNLFSGALLPKLAQAPGVDVSAIIAAGASDLAGAVPPAVLPEVRKAFSFAIERAFILPIVAAGLCLALSFGMQRRWIPDDRVVSQGNAETRDASESTLPEVKGEKETV
ncbi:hypothetical protein MMC25_003336 [Agyrium rufum]|nr:hypothetical protein [Agyrium rufum]